MSKKSDSPFNANRFHNIHFSVLNPKWLTLINDISHYCHPDEPKKRFKLFFRSLFRSKLSGAWYQQIANSSLLTKLVQQEKVLATKLHRHILRMDNCANKRALLLANHYSLTEQLFTSEFLAKVLLKTPLLVTHIEIDPKQCFELCLGFGGYPGKEGELAFFWRERGRGQSSFLARVSFSIIRKDENLAVYIGGLQGAFGENTRERVGVASKLCSGLSPKRAVMEAIFAFAQGIGATQILAVADELQISRDKFGKHSSYDAFWQELRAELTSENDYSLPLQPLRKDIFDAPSKRRAKYRRQHAHLDALYEQTLDCIKGGIHAPMST